MGAIKHQVTGASWPLCDQSCYFDLGHILNSAVVEAIAPSEIGALGAQHAGLWECDLVNGSLIWSGGVYDMFGLERGADVQRDQALAHYSEDSRSKLERLRAYAIRQNLGFTLDIDIRAAAVGQSRRLRVIGAPVYDDGIAVRLHGLKVVL